ncbi:hypothetical protein MKX83_23645 [Cytobacillus sp. FSL M8-0252]|uniref:hypothetical protein n=1 Tax=Cytobacillus sp. FSL M8-0252 TaxID=2921621 RepID=UPI0030FA5AA2
MNQKIKMKEFVKKLELGYMNAAVQYNSMTGVTETVFLIKDYEYRLKQLTRDNFVNVRGCLKYNENATGFIYLVKFGNSANRIYHHWFDKTIQKNDLLYLLDQEKVTYCLVNEKNQIVDFIITSNSTKEIVYQYLTDSQSDWTVNQFNQLIYETMDYYGSVKKIWSYITKNAAS